MMRNYITSTLLFLFSALAIGTFSACDAITGKEVGRLPINANSENGNFIFKNDSVDVKAGESISFWSEMDIEYAQSVGLTFKLKIKKDGVPYGEVEINPFDKKITIGELKTTFGGKTKWKFTGKNLTLTFEKPGNYWFSGILVATSTDGLVVNKAELVLKQ